MLAFSPLVNGRNVLTIDTVKAPGVKVGLIGADRRVCHIFSSPEPKAQR